MTASQEPLRALVRGMEAMAQAYADAMRPMLVALATASSQLGHDLAAARPALLDLEPGGDMARHRPEDPPW
jgi:hypothetical protein